MSGYYVLTDGWGNIVGNAGSLLFVPTGDAPTASVEAMACLQAYGTVGSVGSGVL